MKRPNFERIICANEACELSDSKPIETFSPHQAYSLSEIMSRFEKGQRLPARMLFDPEMEITKNEIYMEDFDDAPPDNVLDVVDVEEHYREHNVHKREFKEKHIKGKGKGAQQSNQATEPEPDDSTSPDPAAKGN